MGSSHFAKLRMAFRRLFDSLPQEAQQEWKVASDHGNRTETTKWLMDPGNFLPLVLNSAERQCVMLVLTNGIASARRGLRWEKLQKLLPILGLYVLCQDV